MNRLAGYLIATLATAAGLHAQSSPRAEVKAGFQGASGNILKAAEKMPEADYNFKPTPDIRTFGQLIAHVADAQLGLCSILKGEPKRGDAASKTAKAELIAALKASSEYCEVAYSGVVDADEGTLVKSPRGDRSKLGLMVFNVAHDNEMYGTIAVYLRLKGIVPPSTADAPPPPAR
jgi:uncharacterized damage-inducible protein DinB